MKMTNARLSTQLLLGLFVLVLCGEVQSCDKCGSGRCCNDDEICDDKHCVPKGPRHDCPSGISYCYKPLLCCGVSTCCPSQSECCGLNTCCPKGAVCCTPNTCCAAGSTCCGFQGCCPPGSTCRSGQCYRERTGFHWYYAVAVAVPLFVIAIVLSRYRRARLARMRALQSAGVIVTSTTMMSPPPSSTGQNLNPYHAGYDPPAYTDAVNQPPQVANYNGDASKDMPEVPPPQYCDVVKQTE